MINHRYPSSHEDRTRRWVFFFFVVCGLVLLLYVVTSSFSSVISSSTTYPTGSRGAYKGKGMRLRYHRSGSKFDKVAVHNAHDENHNSKNQERQPEHVSEKADDHHVHDHDDHNQHDHDDHHHEHDGDGAPPRKRDANGYLLGFKGPRVTDKFKLVAKNLNKPYRKARVNVGRKYPFDDVEDVAERNRRRRDMVRDEFRWAWKAYRDHAWGWDEYHPVSKTPRAWTDSGKGFAMTIFDSLDTMWLMNMTKEFNDAVDYLDRDFDLHQDNGCSTFEATIRLLGGSLSAYEMSGDRRLLRLAERVGWILIAGLETNNGMLLDHVNFKTRAGTSMGWLGGNNLVSELGSLQLEFRTLSYHLKDPIFDMRATHLMSVLHTGCKGRGYACPTMFSAMNGRPSSGAFTLGGMSDSYYEYVVKQYVLTGGAEPVLEEMATTMLRTIADNMLITVNAGGYSITYPGIWDGSFGVHPSNSNLEQIACFSGGMFALAALNFKHLAEPERQRFAQIGGDITETCYNIYATQNTGLSPEEVSIYAHSAFGMTHNEYRMRPETVESIFYLWRVTGDEIWRDRAWEIFDSLVRFCRVPEGGYSGLRDVSISTPLTKRASVHERNTVWDDLQQSYAHAELFKYLFLIFEDEGVVDLQEWVFNTEAHPFKVRTRDPRDVWYEWRKKNGEKPRWIAPDMKGVTPFYPELAGTYRATENNGKA